jgi:hypothetical protein
MSFAISSSPRRAAGRSEPIASANCFPFLAATTTACGQHRDEEGRAAGDRRRRRMRSLLPGCRKIRRLMPDSRSFGSFGTSGHKLTPSRGSGMFFVPQHAPFRGIGWSYYVMAWVGPQPASFCMRVLQNKCLFVGHGEYIFRSSLGRVLLPLAPSSVPLWRLALIGTSNQLSRIFIDPAFLLFASAGDDETSTELSRNGDM